MWSLALCIFIADGPHTLHIKFYPHNNRGVGENKRKSQDSDFPMVKGERTFELLVSWVVLHQYVCWPCPFTLPSWQEGCCKEHQSNCKGDVFILWGVWAVGNPWRCLCTQGALGLPCLFWDSRGPRTKAPIFLGIESALLSSSVLCCDWDGKALLVPSYHTATPFIFFVITAGNFVRLEETFTFIKPPNLHQASDRLGPNGSRFTSFQAPSIRLTVTADGPVILSIFHTQTSGLLTALCTLGNCFCCELNFN